MTERRPPRVMRVQTRMLIWTMVLAVAPLLLLYLALSHMLAETRTLIVKDAGDYAARKTRLLESAIQQDLELTLENNATLLAAAWASLYKKSAAHEGEVLDRFAEALDRSPSITFLFDENGRLTAEHNAGPWADPAATLDDTARRMANQFITITTPLPPTGHKLLLAVPRNENRVWDAAARRFRDDFTTEVNAKVEVAMAQLRLLAMSFLLVLALVSLVMSRWLSHNVGLPLARLSEAMESFDGDSPIPMAGERPDEIGLLTDKFAEMTAKLVEIRREVEKKQEALENADQEMMRLNLNLENRIVQRTAELEGALDRLRELDKNKDDFLSLVSHELKTPLTSISASAEALMATDLPISAEGRRRFLEIIRSEAQRLTRLINDLLDITGMEAGRLHFHFQVFDLTKLAAQTAENFRLAVERKGLRYDIKMADDSRLRAVVMDSDRVVQILTNLIGNAIKFTERGRIAVEVSVAEGATPMARMVVADTGIGIPPEEAPNVFNRFHQIERIDTHHEGFGLGLPISRMLAEGMGGDIQLTSKVDHGTAFTVLLPLDARRSKRGAAAEEIA